MHAVAHSNTKDTPIRAGDPIVFPPNPADLVRVMRVPIARANSPRRLPHAEECVRALRFAFIGGPMALSAENYGAFEG